MATSRSTSPAFGAALACWHAVSLAGSHRSVRELHTIATKVCKLGELCTRLRRSPIDREINQAGMSESLYCTPCLLQQLASMIAAPVESTITASDGSKICSGEISTGCILAISALEYARESNACWSSTQGLPGHEAATSTAKQRSRPRRAPPAVQRSAPLVDARDVLPKDLTRRRFAS